MMRYKADPSVRFIRRSASSVSEYTIFFFPNRGLRAFTIERESGSTDGRCIMPDILILNVVSKMVLVAPKFLNKSGSPRRRKHRGARKAGCVRRRETVS